MCKSLSALVPTLTAIKKKYVRSEFNLQLKYNVGSFATLLSLASLWALANKNEEKKSSPQLRRVNVNVLRKISAIWPKSKWFINVEIRTKWNETFGVIKVYSSRIVC